MFSNDSIFSLTIDRAKGLAILLVVLGHIASPFTAYIFSFHVPLFFFLAGIFIKADYSVSVIIRKNINRLMIPFLIFASFGLMATTIKNVLLNREIDGISDSVFGIIYWMDAPHMHHYGLVLWFLPALFWGRVIIFLAIKYGRLNPVILLVPAAGIAWLVSYYLIIPFGIDKGLVALPWILMGHIFYQFHGKWLSAGWLLIAGAAGLSGLLVYFFGVQSLDLANKGLGNIFITFPYTALMSFMFVSLLYQFGKFVSLRSWQNMDYLADFGRNSMLVLVLHIYTNNAVDVAVSHIAGPGYWYITFILSVLFVYVTIRLKSRYDKTFIFRYL